VLLATLILSVGAIALIWALSSGLSATGDTENTDLALNIAQANMEVIKNQTFAAVSTTAQVSSLISNFGFSNFAVSGVVTTQVASQLIQIDITVSWNVKGGKTSVTLTTLVANNDCGGTSYGGFCWYLGATGTSCTATCTGKGGCANSGWNDTPTCTVCRSFVGAGAACTSASATYLPDYVAAQNQCYRNNSVTVNTSTAAGQRRLCACVQ